ncbi:MAG: hypothetical protein IID44_02630 [Planctomycetes bacterium]|nr:hypothetical protein [Planctomycetota bacterium]
MTFRESMRALRFVEKTGIGVTPSDNLERRFGGVFRLFFVEKKSFWPADSVLTKNHSAKETPPRRGLFATPAGRYRFAAPVRNRISHNALRLQAGLLLSRGTPLAHGWSVKNVPRCDASDLDHIAV